MSNWNIERKGNSLELGGYVAFKVDGEGKFSFGHVDPAMHSAKLDRKYFRKFISELTKLYIDTEELSMEEAYRTLNSSLEEIQARMSVIDNNE